MYLRNRGTMCVRTEFHPRISVDRARKATHIFDIFANLEKFPVRLLHLVAEIIAAPLSAVYNRIINGDEMPCYLKAARVIPLHKGGSREEVGNYWPISILSVFATIFEKIIAARMFPHVDRYHLPPRQQLGFRKGVSCATDAIYLLSSIVDHMVEGRVGALFVDIKNAFPSVDHYTLKQMFTNMQGLGECPVLLASYLDGRTMFVDNGGVLSETGEITRGVPQGSVIAPLLFNLYYSGIVSCFAERDILLYADDTVIISSSTDIISTISKLSESALIVERYLQSMSMRLNTGKSYYMMFNVPAELGKGSLTTANWSIQRVESFKYLGIWFDSDLSFNVHCTKLIAHAKSKLYILLRYPRYRNHGEWRILFYAYILPLFLYGTECYMHCGVSLRQKLEHLYRKCGRIVLGNAQSKYDNSIYLRLNVLPLRFLFQLRCATFMYITMNHEGSSMFNGHFSYNRSNSRYSHDLALPKVISELSRRSVRYWGAKLWNSIPLAIRCAQCLGQFTPLYKAYLESKITQYLDTYDLYDFI
jgi:hypothetical protein